MNWDHVFQVFRKDGLEILRDRRTLFVNIVLPMLLYPLLLLFALQVAQITRTQKVEPAVVALVGAPDSVREELLRQEKPKKAKDEADPFAEGGSGDAVTAPEVSAADQQALRGLADELAPLEQQLSDAEERDQEAPEEVRERYREARRHALERLRAMGATAAVVIDAGKGKDGADRAVVLQDDASRRSDAAEEAIRRSLTAYRQRLVKERLDAAHLPESTVKPLTIAMLHTAPAAEAVRMRISGILPVLLVVLAASGAFFPALDLIAGERERGTLESLLSWPARRRDLFVGKLLVACAAAASSVVLNICSLGATIAVGGSQIQHGGGGDFGGLFSVGIGALLLCCLVLLPLTITLAATALAVTGLASSAKEAQNYLTPFFLVVFAAAIVSVIPGTRPGFVLDLIPIVGPVLSLKESLQAAHMPWGHLALSTAASVALAWVVIGWSARLLEDERFRYPGLVRAGWGRFRSWGAPPPVPGGLEVMAVYAIAVAGFTLLSGHLIDFSAITVVAVPLIAFAATPALLHCWLGAYDPRSTLSLRAPSARGLGCGVLLGACAIVVSIAIGNLQRPLFPEGEGSQKVEEILQALQVHGLAATVLLIAVLPGICEELLFRGTILSGLTRGIGRGGAVVVSAFLFAAMHGSPERFLPQLVLGMFLAGLVIRSGSIVPAMVAHAIHNGTVVVLETHGLALQQAMAAWAAAHATLVVPAAAAAGVGGIGGTIAAVVLARPRQETTTPAQV